MPFESFQGRSSCLVLVMREDYVEGMREITRESRL